jgi:hypothetical protein
MRKHQEEVDAMPPGTRLMGEAERQDTLVDLRKNKAEVNTALEKLPIGSSTMTM